MEKKVKILGTEYTIKTNCNDVDYPCLKENDGTCDVGKKEILIRKFDEDKVSNVYDWFYKVLIHELIHAFTYESGLWGESDWATNEEMVDWFAIQFLKIYSAFKETSYMVFDNYEDELGDD